MQRQERTTGRIIGPPPQIHELFSANDSTQEMSGNRGSQTRIATEIGQPYAVRPFYKGTETFVAINSFELNRNEGLTNFTPESVLKRSLEKYIRKHPRDLSGAIDRYIASVLSIAQEVPPLMREEKGPLHPLSQTMKNRWNRFPFDGDPDFVAGVLKRDPDSLAELYDKLGFPLPGITWTSDELFTGHPFPNEAGIFDLFSRISYTTTQ